MVTTSHSQSLAMPRENKIMAKGETERQKGKQASETIFYLKRFTSQHRATKNLGTGGNYFIPIFSVRQHVRYQRRASDSPLNRPSDSAGKFCLLLVLNDKPVHVKHNSYYFPKTNLGPIALLSGRAGEGGSEEC